MEKSENTDNFDNWFENSMKEREKKFQEFIKENLKDLQDDKDKED